MDVSIIIPARDESGNLPDLLDEIGAAMQPLGLRYEVLVVDDGSSDDSWSMLAARTASDDTLRPIRHRRSAGQSTSIWQAARLARGRWLATLDGDGQNDPADLPRLLERARSERLEMVAGHRTTRRDTWFKRFSSRVANGVRSRLLRDSTPDTGCGLKVIRRDAFLKLPYFDHMHRYLPALIQFQGGRCESVPVNHRPRGTGASHYGLNNRLWAGLLDLMGVMWLRRRCRLPAECETMEGKADKEEQA
ncbi:MAG: glycosyltransferase [Wenzhouxiangella sp.]|jgi:dolichol-phosphate mannosyltransferase|nr:glycosyltransferase [Wenzhouxiangella sp.]